MPHEKRATERLEILGALQGDATVVQSIAVRQLSAGGAQIESRVSMHLDSVHDFRLVLGDRAVIAKGRVVHCEISDVDQDGVVYRAGIEFLDPPERVARAIAEYVEGMKAERRG
jgi:hypothetical protein